MADNMGYGIDPTLLQMLVASTSGMSNKNASSTLSQQNRGIDNVSDLMRFLMDPDNAALLGGFDPGALPGEYEPQEFMPQESNIEAYTGSSNAAVARIANALMSPDSRMDPYTLTDELFNDPTFTGTREEAVNLVDNILGEVSAYRREAAQFDRDEAKRRADWDEKAADNPFTRAGLPSPFETYTADQVAPDELGVKRQQRVKELRAQRDAIRIPTTSSGPRTAAAARAAMLQKLGPPPQPRRDETSGLPMVPGDDKVVAPDGTVWPAGLDAETIAVLSNQMPNTPEWVVPGQADAMAALGRPTTPAPAPAVGPRRITASADRMERLAEQGDPQVARTVDARVKRSALDKQAARLERMEQASRQSEADFMREQGRTPLNDAIQQRVLMARMMGLIG